ncbi:hypothetical protein PsorP6_017558 [Peronosclerospora sorghi]|uniref:Uncharacterized protein n=1 Tax=Peronosclerospora sorghi TaxID=230839 RepID=A0ACC0WNM0_9STRA|nr:hypothetical protein PsorP6_017558 [Peronosclerospora sorghi]
MPKIVKECKPHFTRPVEAQCWDPSNDSCKKLRCGYDLMVQKCLSDTMTMEEVAVMAALSAGMT